MFAEDPNVFLRDFGVSCGAGGVSFLGILDAPDQAMSMAGVNVLSTMYALRCATADAQAAGLATGVGVTVAGVPYTVRDVVAEDDALFSVISLSK